MKDTATIIREAFWRDERHKQQLAMELQRQEWDAMDAEERRRGNKALSTPLEFESVASPRPGATSSKNTSKRDKQIRAIESVIKELGLNHFEIPDGKKKAIGEICRQRYANLFGHGPDPFKEAWQKAVKLNLVRMKNHEKYAKR